MENALSISPSSKVQAVPLSEYDYGVIYKINTVGKEYETDKATAEKLSHVLLAAGDTKFVKVQTFQGIVVLNVASIMGITTDDTGVIRILNRLVKTVERVNLDRGIDGKPHLAMEDILDNTDPEKVDYFTQTINSEFRYEGRNQQVTIDEVKHLIEKAKNHKYIRLQGESRFA